MKKPRSDKYLFWERALDKWAGSILLRLLTLFHPQRQPFLALSDRHIHRILAIKLHGIGNLVMMMPSLGALRKRFPGAEIDLLTFESNAPLVAGMADVTNAFFLQRRNVPKVVWSLLRTLPRLRRRRYELVVDFEQFAYVSAIVAYLVGRRHRIGFLNPTHSRHLAFTLPVAYAETGHMTRIFGRLAEAAGAPVDGKYAPCLLPTEENRREALALLTALGIGSSDCIVVLHPGSSPNLVLRRWPVERFAALGDRLVRERGGRIVVGGDPSEIELARSVVERMTEPAVSVAGQLSLLGYAALLARSRLVVSNDTAAVHLGAAVGTPVAGIYGPNVPALYGPEGPRDAVFYHSLPCSPCLKNVNRKTSVCTHARCIDAITVDEVFACISHAIPGTMPPAAQANHPGCAEPLKSAQTAAHSPDTTHDA